MSLRSGRPVLPIAILLVMAAWLWVVDARTLIPALAIQMVTLLFAGSMGSGQAADHTDPDALLHQLHDVMTRSWAPLAAANRFVDRTPDGVQGTGAVPPRVASWPQGLRGPWSPDAKEGRGMAARIRLRRPPQPRHLSVDAVGALVAAAERAGRTLVIHGRPNSGTGTALLALFTAAQQERSRRVAAGDAFPLPVWVSLAGWTPGPPDGAAPADLGAGVELRDWVIDQLNDRYPELFAGEPGLDRALRSAWLGETTDRLMLFLDDGEERVGPVLRSSGNQLVVIAAGPDDVPPGGCETLELQPVTEDDVRAFLGRGYPRVEAAARAGALSPRRLSLLSELRRAGVPLVASSVAPEEVADALLPLLWPAAPQQAESTLRWIAGHGLFSGAGFAWWRVPQLAETASARHTDADDDAPPAERALARAYRQVKRERARSAARWALGAFGLGATLSVALAVLGELGGFDRAGHGLAAARGLRFEDVVGWVYLPPPGWGWGWIFGLPSANPLVLVVLVAGLVTALVLALARFGGELGSSRAPQPHRVGHPQTIRPAWPGLRDLPDLARGIGGPRALLLAAGVLLAWMLPALGVGDGTEWWPGVAYTAVLLAVLAWLRWCTGPATPLSAAEAMERERASSRTVAVTVGTALAVASAGLTWWFSSGGSVPTLQQAVWISASVGMSVGVARGVQQGSGMGLPWSPWRPGLGLGYADRLDRLERVLRRRLAAGTLDPTLPLPVAVTPLLRDLERPAGADGLHARLLLRPVGTLVRPREPRFALFDPHQGAAAGTTAAGAAAGATATGWTAAVVRPAGWRRPVSLLGAGALVLGLVLASSGVVPAALPRLPCRGDVSSAAILDSGASTRQVWLDNGQCVGFVVPDRGVAGFGQLGRPETAADRVLAGMLARIATQNAAVDAARGDRVRTVAFFAPLSRSLPDNPINALYQLGGAAAAQEALNRAGGTQVRLVVANSGDNFVSGPSVAQAMRRAFSVADASPSDGAALRAVIGLSQSRASTLESVHVLTEADPRLWVVAASVNGSTMRSGGVLQLGPGDRFLGVAPGDHRVARAMLLQARSALPRGAAAVHVLYDENDTFFSNELKTALAQQAPGLGLTTVPERFDETADEAMTRDLAGRLCDATGTGQVWLFAGRGAQLRQLAGAMSELVRTRVKASCAPTVIAGPGGLSMVADPDYPGPGAPPLANGPWRNLSFYSLATPADAAASAAAASGRPASPGGPAAAQESERRTGYAALLLAVRQLPGAGVPCGPGLRSDLGLRFPRDSPDAGHNTLGPALPADAACAAPGAGSRIWFCPVSGAGCGAGFTAAQLDDVDRPGGRT